LIVNGECMSTR